MCCLGCVPVSKHLTQLQTSCCVQMLKHAHAVLQDPQNHAPKLSFRMSNTPMQKELSPQSDKRCSETLGEEVRLVESSCRFGVFGFGLSASWARNPSLLARGLGLDSRNLTLETLEGSQTWRIFYRRHVGILTLGCKGTTSTRHNAP